MAAEPVHSVLRMRPYRSRCGQHFFCLRPEPHTHGALGLGFRGALSRPGRMAGPPKTESSSLVFDDFAAFGCAVPAYLSMTPGANWPGCRCLACASSSSSSCENSWLDDGTCSGQHSTAQRGGVAIA